MLEVLDVVFVFLAINLSFTAIGVQLRPESHGRLDPALLVVIFSSSAALLHHFLLHSNYLVYFPHGLYIGIPFAYLGWAAFYFFVRLRLSDEPVRPLEWILNALPLSLSIAYLMPFFAKSTEEKLELIQLIADLAPHVDSIYDPRINVVPVQLAIFVCAIFYAIIIYRSLFEFRRRNPYAVEEISWLRKATHAYNLFTVGPLVGVAYKYTIDNTPDTRPFLFIVRTAFVLGLMWLNFLILRTPQFSSLPSQRKISPVDPDSGARLDPDASYAAVEKWLEMPLDESTFDARFRTFVLDHLDDSQANRTFVAAHLGISDRQLARETQRMVELSPHQLLQYLRAREGLRLLRTTNLSVKEVSVRCGFASSDTFRRATMNVYGKTPSELT